jgi:dTDP-4-amino-4,6-dideoxygalactose transaminase
MNEGPPRRRRSSFPVASKHWPSSFDEGNDDYIGAEQQSLSSARASSAGRKQTADTNNEVALSVHSTASGIHNPVPVHRQPACAELVHADALPQSEKAAAEVLSLPLYPELTDDQIQRVTQALTSLATTR